MFKGLEETLREDRRKLTNDSLIITTLMAFGCVLLNKTVWLDYAAYFVFVWFLTVTVVSKFITAVRFYRAYLNYHLVVIEISARALFWVIFIKFFYERVFG